MNTQTTWEQRDAARRLEIEAANLTVGDVITYTNAVQNRLGTTTQRTYTMEITEVNGTLVKGLNANTSKLAKAYLMQVVRFSVLSRGKVAA